MTGIPSPARGTATPGTVQHTGPGKLRKISLPPTSCSRRTSVARDIPLHLFCAAQCRHCVTGADDAIEREFPVVCHGSHGTPRNESNAACRTGPSSANAELRGTHGDAEPLPGHEIRQAVRSVAPTQSPASAPPNEAFASSPSRTETFRPAAMRRRHNGRTLPGAGGRSCRMPRATAGPAIVVRARSSRTGASAACRRGLRPGGCTRPSTRNAGPVPDSRAGRATA